MTDYKQYVCFESTKTPVLGAVIKDIQDTFEQCPQYSQKYKQQERLIKAIHGTLRRFYEDSLFVFVGVKYIHWFAYNNKSVHFKRDELLHLSDEEIIELMIETVTNQDWWLDCDVSTLENNMPHKSGKAMCLECGHKWDVIYSIIDEQKTHTCDKCENSVSVIVDLQGEQRVRSNKK